MLFANLYVSIICGSYFLSKDFFIFFFILNIFVFYIYPLGVVTDIFFKRSLFLIDVTIIFLYVTLSKDFFIFFFILNIFVFYIYPLGVVTDIFFKRSLFFLTL